MLKISNRITRKRYGIRPKSTIKTTEQYFPNIGVFFRSPAYDKVFGFEVELFVRGHEFLGWYVYDVRWVLTPTKRNRYMSSNF